jgi:hypothetical protein
MSARPQNPITLRSKWATAALGLTEVRTYTSLRDVCFQSESI